MRTVMSTMSSSNVGKLPPIPCNGWCYTEAEEDIVYDYAWTIERFSRHAVNFRTGNVTLSDYVKIFIFVYCREDHVF